MSSIAVKTKFDNFLDTEITTETKIVDVTGSFDELKDFREINNIGLRDRWLAVQYVGAEEEPISVASNNSQGKYREYGSIFLHVIDPVSPSSQVSILTRAKNIRDKIRGQNIDGIRIESVTPPNFEAGATLNFDGGYTAAAIVINYEYDINL